jgi:hypothetical protein
MRYLVALLLILSLSLPASAQQLNPGGGIIPVPASTVIATGTVALSTAAIAAGICVSSAYISQPLILPTDNVIWNHAAVPTANNGLLSIHAVAGAGVISFIECNPTANSITPVADTLNYAVIR